ncbi:MAG: bifunctional riboflavin kinase/FAD synthetase [Verrucomicrobiaceae bacterium]|nr:bifunctional riboflavin kinase/FAD synthetase [Verrucomicrobiaceae bacterium]
MTLLRALHELSRLNKPVVLACGVFDGVHRGHQQVLNAAKAKAHALGALVVVVTFDPHPVRLLRPEQAPPLLCSSNHELLILERLGVDVVLVCPFDHARAAQPAGDFVEELVQSCFDLRAICVGEDWRFGKDRAGDVALLRAYGERFGFEAVGVPLLQLPGVVVSSTLIRQAVKDGDLARAREMLGRYYSVYGTVVHGDALARTLGFPTANIAVENEQLPPAGVYVVQAHWQGRVVPGVANLGRRPTVTLANQDLSLEVHLFDFDADLYGQTMEVDFLQHLRAEIAFPGLDALKAQIAQDCEVARRYFADLAGSGP